MPLRLSQERLRPGRRIFGRQKSAGFDDDTLKFSPPDLVVEVLSESTESKDRGVKFEDYAANNVREYWIADSEQLCLEQYLLRNDKYELKLKSPSGTLECEVVDGFVTEVESLFDSQRNLAAIRKLLSE